MKTAENKVQQSAVNIKFPDQKILYDKVDKAWYHFGGDEPIDEKEVAKKFPNVVKWIQTWRQHYEDSFDQAHQKSQEVLDKQKEHHQGSERYEEFEEKINEERQKAVQEFLEHMYQGIKEQAGSADEKLNYVVETIRGILQQPAEGLRAVAHLLIAESMLPSKLESQEAKRKLRSAALQISMM